MKEGVIIKNIAGQVSVHSEQNIYSCILRGKVKQKYKKIMVGDRCIFDETALSIEEILPRKNELIRPPVSNIDQIIAFISLVPEPDYSLIDKIIIEGMMIDAKLILVISKNDLIEDDNFIKNIKNEYKDSFDKIIVTSSKNGFGIPKLYDIIDNSISVFVGQSGVGKSSLINALFNQNIREVGVMSAKDMRGKNTTRSSEILFYKNGIIIDSPGFNMLDITSIKSSDLKYYFSEIQKYADKCLYSSCDHISSSDDVCNVKRMLNENKISKSRYDRYKSLYALLKKEEQYKYGKKGKSFS